MRLRSSAAAVRRREQAVDLSYIRPKKWCSQLIADVHSNDRKKQLKAAKKIRKLMSEDSDPMDRMAIIDADLVPRFEKFLQVDCEQLKIEAARVLISIIFRTFLYTDVSFEEKRMEILLNLLGSPISDVREQAVLGLGHVAVDSIGRDLVHKHDAVLHLVNTVKLNEFSENDQISMLRAATWTLLNFCKGKPQPGVFEEVEDSELPGCVYRPVGFCKVRHLDKVKLALPALCRLIHSTDGEVLTNVCSVFSCLSDATHYGTLVVVNANTCQRLVELLKHHSSSVVVPALCTVANIAGDDIQSKRIVRLGALSSLLSLLQNGIKEEEVCRTSIEKQICLTIANITDGKYREEQVEAVISAQLIDPLLKLVQDTKDEGIKAVAARAISKTITGGTIDQIKSLERCIEPLCNLLVFNNQDIVTPSLDALVKILEAGKPRRGKENVYAKMIKDFGGLEKIVKLKTRRRLHVRVVDILKKYW